MKIVETVEWEQEDYDRALDAVRGYSDYGSEAVARAIVRSVPVDFGRRFNAVANIARAGILDEDATATQGMTRHAVIRAAFNAITDIVIARSR